MKMCSNTYLMPLLSNFEVLTPLESLAAQVFVLHPLDFRESDLFPPRASYLMMSISQIWIRFRWILKDDVTLLHRRLLSFVIKIFTSNRYLSESSAHVQFFYRGFERILSDTFFLFALKEASKSLRHE